MTLGWYNHTLDGRTAVADYEFLTVKMLKPGDRKYLKGLAHHLKPVVHVGKQGLIANLITTLNKALDAHELIKVKFVDLKEQRRELSLEIATRTNSELAGLVGNIAILYRQHPDREKRKIRLPSLHVPA